ncbi:YqgE/AlgH family protein [Corynebacterium timonense]|uniref:Putative transcriptional regulator n=1 Tax=Corynebacterium timonense TaxID=441500 RepID=A0A1H1UGU9_9CORY|nr:YqgE/AlgH family protein [Corynebacterium timonense]SDS71511.1 putative transcriptional regulator [Corynebacterium timonense]
MAEYFYADRLFNALERSEPEAGSLLVAAPGMLSDAFARTVVLVLGHSAVGTLGVVLNRRSEVAVQNVLPEWESLTAAPRALYIGGPVRPQAGVAVGVTKNGVAIEDYPQFTRLANRLVHLDLHAHPLEVEDALEGVRIFVGTAQWEPGQLDGEIERGDWFVAPALPSDVVAPAAVDLWGDVMRRQAMPLPLFSTFPADIQDS